MLYRADDSILVKFENDPLCGYTRESFMEELRKKLSGRVKEAWLFGSFAGGSFGKFSDIDLILVCDTDKPFPLRNRLYDDLYDLGPEMDILVYTEKEFDSIRDNPPGGFWKSILSTMMRLI